MGDSQGMSDKPRVAHIEDDVQLHIFSGYQVKLYVDECDSYYHNLMSPSPRVTLLYVMTTMRINPFRLLLVSALMKRMLI